jgi:hypothetical protein
VRCPITTFGLCAIGCLLAAAMAPACTFSARALPGQISCSADRDCPTEVPVCRRNACYASVINDDASRIDSASDGAVDGADVGANDSAVDGAAADVPDVPVDGHAPDGGHVDVGVDIDMEPEVADWPVCTPPVVASLAQGLVAYLRLDDGPPDPVIADSSPNKLSVMLNQINPQTAWTSGRFGRALSLSGGAAGGYVTVGPPQKLNVVAANLSVSAWIKFPGGAASDGVVVGRRAAGAAGYHYLISVSANHLRVRLQSSNGLNADLTSNQPLPSGSQWMHLGVTYVADVAITNGLRLYVNGKPFGTMTFPLPFGTENTPLVVGAAEAPNRDLPSTQIVDRLAAVVDEVALYNRVLSPDEITALACGAQPIP